MRRAAAPPLITPHSPQSRAWPLEQRRQSLLLAMVGVIYAAALQ